MSYGRGRGGGYGGGGRSGRGGGRGGSRGPRKYDARKIFVGGVSRRDTDNDSFEKFFSSFGELEDIILMKAVDGSGHRGFGFVTYREQKVTDLVLAKRRDLELDGKKIDVKMALPEELKPPEGADGKKIFVGSLPKEDFSSEDLKEYFGQWGVVTDSYVSPGRGFGFISYETSTGAYKALIHGSNNGHMIGSIQVSAKWPIPKEPVRQGRDAGFDDRGFGSARFSGGASGFDDRGLISARFSGGPSRQYGSVGASRQYDGGDAPWPPRSGGYASRSPGFQQERYPARSYSPPRGYQDSGRERYRPY